MNERLEASQFDNAKGIRNLKESGTVLDKALQQELREFSLGEFSDWERNYEEWKSRLEAERAENPEMQERYQRNIEAARQITQKLRPCHITGGEALEHILIEGRFRPYHEVRSKHQDVRTETYSSDIALDLDLSTFCGFGKDMHIRQGKQFIVIFKEETLVRKDTATSLFDAIALYPKESHKAVPADSDIRKLLDTYRKNIMSGEDMREMMAGVGAANFDNPEEIWDQRKYLPTPWKDRWSPLRSPEVHLVDPTLDDVEAIAIYADSSYQNTEEIAKRMRGLGKQVIVMDDEYELGDVNEVNYKLLFEQLDSNQPEQS